MEKISVIVPVYNTGTYLKQCVDSILTQSYQNLDVILFNDGSTDGSGTICEEYATQDSRVQAIHNTVSGSGVGAARNKALKYVKGDYILFVDHDDWLEPNHIELLYTALKKTDSDISIANFTQFFNDRQSFAFHVTASDYFQKTYSPQEWFKYQYNGKQPFSQCFTVPWCKLYKASLFETVVYPENEKVEDDYTTWKVYLMADKIVFTNVAIYYHRKLSTSVTGGVQDVHVFPLRSIEERVTLLALAGLDISEELRAYRWRLRLHQKSYLKVGMITEYKACLQKLAILERWQEDKTHNN